MRSNCGLVMLSVSLAVGVAGCASPPSADVELAKTTINKAVLAGAGSFAPESLQAAVRAQAALDTELQAQDGKWFKSYANAKDLAVAAQAAGNKAAADATAGKEETMADATAAAGDVQHGPTLFQNGDFADGLQGWSTSRDSDAAVSIDVSASNEQAWHVKYRKGDWCVIYQGLSLRPDTVYVYEATVKSTAPVVALYWEADTGRFFQENKTYPEWTPLRYVFLTPHWTGQAYRANFHPVLMKGAGEAWVKNLRLSQFKARGSKAPR